MTTEASWTQTYSGKAFAPMSPTLDMVCIEDIMHGLSNVCRFSGQTQEFYSVAQHSVLVSQIISTLPAFEPLSVHERRPLLLASLLHDASEAYIVDVPTPIKRHLHGYLEIEEGVMRVIAQKFELDFALFSNPLIKQADTIALATEKRDVMGPEPQPWVELPPPWPHKITAMPCFAAKKHFAMRFEQLGGKF
jgi:uncharacterized protein